MTPPLDHPPHVETHLETQRTEKSRCMSARFNPAPGWPSAPSGWLPPAGWRPDPAWPAAPEGWPLVVHDTMGFTDASFGFSVEPARPYASVSILPSTTRTSRGRMLNLLRARVSH